MDEISKNILDTVLIGALATVNQDGSPLITPLHFARMEDYIIYITDENSQHSKNTERGERVEFSAWNDQKQAIYIKSIVEKIPKNELEKSEICYKNKLADFKPNLKNPAYYKVKIGIPDEKYERGIWQHYIS